MPMNEFPAFEKIEAGQLIALESTKDGVFARVYRQKRGDVLTGVAVNDAFPGGRVGVLYRGFIYPGGFDIEKYYADLQEQTSKLMIVKTKKRVGILWSILAKLQKLCKLR
jgi:hypothetical protein